MFRLVSGRVLLIAALPATFFGLIDPLEGGVALFVAMILYAAAFILLKRRPDREIWIPLLASFLSGAAILAYVIFGMEPYQGQPRGLPGELIAGLWVYRACVIAMLLGGVWALIKEFRRGDKASGDSAKGLEN